MKKSKLLLSALLSLGMVSSSAFLFSCGGGGSSSSGGSGGSSAQTTTYLAYHGSIHLVDPTNPSSTIDLSSKPTMGDFAPLVVDSFDPTTKSYKGLRQGYVFWIENGRLYKANLTKGSSAPQKQQLSNRTDVCKIVKEINDPISKKTYIHVRTAGEDANCLTSDDEYYLITSNMDETEEAISMGLKYIMEKITGGINNPEVSGFLVEDEGNYTVEKCDTDMNNCENLMSLNDIYYMAENPDNGHLFFCVQPSSGGDYYIYEFDGTDLKKLTNSDNEDILCTNFDEDNIVSDDTAIYTLDSDNNLIKITFDGEETTLYNSSSGSVTLKSIKAITDNYIVAYGSGIGINLIGIPKDGGSTWDLIPPEEDGYPYSYYFFGIGNRLYVNFRWINDNGDLVDVKACVAQEGEDLQCDDSSYWVGYSIKQNGELNLKSNLYPAYKLLRVEKINIYDNDESGGTLYAVDPENLSSKIKLGEVPEYFEFSLEQQGVGKYMLIDGFDQNSEDEDDVFFVNLDQQGSLNRLTTTTNHDEFPIGTSPMPTLEE